MRISDQMWMCGTSKTIHDVEKELTDADVQRGVEHDLAGMELQWAKNKLVAAKKRRDAN